MVSFNNCPLPRKVVQWQYFGSEPQRLIGVNSYSIIRKPGQCPISYAIEFFVTYSNGFQRFEYTYQYGKIGGWRITTLGSRKTLELEHGTQDNPNAKVWTGVSSTSSFDYGLVYINSIMPTDSNSPDDCGSWVFSVSRGEELMYIRDFEDKPLVDTYCLDGECPPNTCKCDCGNLVCCYDVKTGKAVYSFPK